MRFFYFFPPFNEVQTFSVDPENSKFMLICAVIHAIINEGIYSRYQVKVLALLNNKKKLNKQSNHCDNNILHIPEGEFLVKKM